MSTPTGRGRRTIALAAACVAALVLGAVALTLGLRGGDPPPEAGASASSERSASTSDMSPGTSAGEEQEGPGAEQPTRADTSPPSAEVSSGPASTVVLPRARPTRLEVPGIGVDQRVFDVGQQANGELEVPEGDQVDDVGWYRQSPTPGQLGPAVLLGHVDGESGPSVFYRLGELTDGDEVTVRREDGRDATFEVYDVQRYPKDEFPTEAVYGNTEEPELRLITCSGDFDSETGHYLDNTVVSARLVG